jgi:hypothetical protein
MSNYKQQPGMDEFDKEAERAASAMQRANQTRRVGQALFRKAMGGTNILPKRVGTHETKAA